MYSEMRKFWFCAHKVLPLVYDDSLSYYEVLCKVVAKLNECIDKINELGNELDEFEGWTREEFQKVRDEMAAEIQRVEGLISVLDSKVDREVGRLDGRVDALGTDLGNRISAVMANFCGGWIAGSSYQVGAIVRCGDTVYECNTANEDAEFTPAHWTAKTIKSVIDDVNTALESEIQGVRSLVREVRDMIAPEFRSNVDYSEGDYVTYLGNLYRANQDITRGDWDSTKWTQTTACSGIKSAYDIGKSAYDKLSIPTYSSTETYNEEDIVIYQSGVYYCNEDNITGVTPTSAPNVWKLIWSDADSFYNKGVASELYNIGLDATYADHMGTQALDFISARPWGPGLNYSENEIVYNEGSVSGTRHYYIANEDITNSQDITQENFTTIDDINDLMGFVRYKALTQSEYDSLVALGAVRSKTLYFIY